jgi:hypothetical protein
MNYVFNDLSKGEYPGARVGSGAVGRRRSGISGGGAASYSCKESGGTGAASSRRRRQQGTCALDFSLLRCALVLYAPQSLSACARFVDAPVPVRISLSRTPLSRIHVSSMTGGCTYSIHYILPLWPMGSRRGVSMLKMKVQSFDTKRKLVEHIKKVS